MGNELISESLIDIALHLLDTKTPFRKESISYEIQDDAECILITIPIDDFPKNEPAFTFKNAGLILNEIMPNRANDYSWIIAFTENGKVVRSHFGGNLASPNSGL